VTYNGSVNQLIGPVNYNNLVINNAAAILSINTATNITGNLSINAGELINNAATTISGNVTIASGATYQNNNSIHVGGNWNNSGTYNGNGINVIFDGSGTQTISSSTFNNLEFNKPVGSVAVLSGAVTIKGNVDITSGTLDIVSYAFNRDVAGGTATITDNATIIIGANNAPANFSTYSFSSGSTVIFNGTGTQNLLLPGVAYGNLIFRNSGTKILNSNTTVMGNLTIESGATFDAGSYTISLNGNWVNSGTFTPATSTLICTGTTKTLTGVTTFNNITASGSYTFLSNLTFNGLITILSTGSLSAGSGILTTVNGDLSNSGILYNLGTTTFTGNVQQTLSLINAVQTVALVVNFNGTVPPLLNSTSTPQFGYININNTGGVSPSVGWTILYSMTVGSGATFNGGSSSHNLLGSLTNNGTITSTGTFSFIPSTAKTLNFGTGFTSTGRVYFGGAGAITLSGTPVSFANVNITNTNAAGISPSSNWILTKDLTVVTGTVLNAGSYTYTIGGNIIDNGTINAGTSTFALNGSIDQEINSGSSFNNFTVNKSSGSAWLSNNLSVNGNLNFIAGKVQTGAFIVAQSSTGSVSGAAQNTGWVNGKLKKYISTGATNKTFEVGDGTNYTAVALAFSNVSVGGDLTAFATIGEHPAISSSSINPSKSVNRFWTLTNSGVSFNNYNATFNFVAGDIDAGASTANFDVANYNGSSWSVPVSALHNTTNIQATGVTAFGDFAIGQICNKGTTITYAGSPFCTNAGAATVTITGTTGGTFTSDAGLVINATSGSVNLSLSTIGDHIITYTVAGTSDCGQYITTANITIAVAGTWTGAVNTDWDNAGNWACGGVPTSTTDVTIPSGLTNYPIVIITKALNNITIQSGASVAVNNATLRIAGDLTSSGNFSSWTGTIELNGTTDQIIPAGFFTNNTFKNLIINNNVSLAGRDTLTGTLTIMAGNTFTTNDNLILKSDSTGTARIATLPVDGSGVATAFITGNVTIERFIPAKRVWRLLSAPLSSTGAPTINESWQEGATTASATPNPNPGYGTHITGGTVANGFDQNATNAASIKYFNPLNNGLPGVTSTNIPITTYPGYFLFIRGDRSNNLALGAAAPATNTTLRMKGQIATGTKAITINTANYTLVGNPYPSAIDFGTLTKTNVANTIYIWDPKLGGSNGVGGYVTGSWNAGTSTYNFTTANSPVSQYIPSGEAFFVTSLNGTTAGTLAIKETDKTTLGSDQVFGIIGGTQNPNVRIDLFAVNANASTALADGTLATFYDGNNNGVDDEDAKKMNNSGENISVKREGILLSIERRKMISNPDTLFVNVAQLKQQTYKLVINIEDLGDGVIALLKDKLSGSIINDMPLNMAGTNDVTFTVTSNTATSAADRFSIVFMPAAVVPVTIQSIKAKQQQKDIVVSWHAENQVNIASYNVHSSLDGINFIAENSIAATNNTAADFNWIDVDVVKGFHYYKVVATGKGGEKYYSSIVKVNVGGTIDSNQFSILSSGSITNTLAIQVNAAKGDFECSVISANGQVVKKQIINHIGGIINYTLDLPVSMAAGKYQLIISGKETHYSAGFFKQ
ncbi:MAG: hypothetical protein ABIY51_04255, partial [Ferruginibacter sp.]